MYIFAFVVNLTKVFVTRTDHLTFRCSADEGSRFWDEMSPIYLTTSNLSLFLAAIIQRHVIECVVVVYISNILKRVAHEAWWKFMWEVVHTLKDRQQTQALSIPSLGLLLLLQHYRHHLWRSQISCLKLLYKWLLYRLWSNFLFKQILRYREAFFSHLMKFTHLEYITTSSSVYWSAPYRLRGVESG